MPRHDGKLTAKQKRFVEEYLVDLNATQAAIRAGYKPSCAAVVAHENLRKQNVAEEISKARARITEKMEIKQDNIVRELARVALSDVRRIFKDDGTVKAPHELDDATAAAVSSIEFDADSGFKVKLWDKNSAADKLMKFLGAYERDNSQTTSIKVESIDATKLSQQALLEILAAKDALK